MRVNIALLKVFAMSGMVLCAGSLRAAELDCKEPYTVSSGDTLSGIASRAYDNSAKYNLIFYANREQMPSGPSVIRVGQQLRIPCAESAAEGTEAVEDKPEEQLEKKAEEQPEEKEQEATQAVVNTTDASNTEVSINNDAPTQSFQRTTELLTAGDYPPFTDPELPGGGLITELLESAMKSSEMPYRLNWINDWAAHLDPLLSEKKYDVGFPWFDPGCPESDSPRCAFLFSKPVFELLIVLFTRTEQPLKFVQDDDIMGKTLCRPAGYFTHDLDNNGRNWLKDGKVTLEQPKSVKDCFDLLMDGKVDAVAINDFTGRESMSKLGLTDKVMPVERELSIEGLHALVHKTHPRATILINRINRGLDKLHASGQYDEIMDRHLLNHWKNVESN